MNKTLGILLISISLFSCNKETVPLTKAQVNYKIDSTIKAENKASEEDARIDLERRMEIEVKVKADSILNARTLKTKKDTAVIKKPIPVQ